jgi:hypothetical protein
MRAISPRCAVASMHGSAVALGARQYLSDRP